MLSDKEVPVALPRLMRYESAIERCYYEALKAAKAEMKNQADQHCVYHQPSSRRIVSRDPAGVGF